MNKYIIFSAKAISSIFAPWNLALLGYTLLLLFSYMNGLPWQVIFILLLTVYFFTMFLPHLCISIYARANGLKGQKISRREYRIMPYFFNIICYCALLFVLNKIYHTPLFSQGIILCALMLQIVCSITNIWIKVSTHAAGAAGFTGALMAFSLTYGFNPTGWLCLSVLICGAVCSSRMILRQHTLGEVGLGTLIGLLCGWCIVLFL